MSDLCMSCESMLEVNLDGPDVTIVPIDVLCVRLQEPVSENKRARVDRTTFGDVVEDSVACPLF